MMLDMTLNVPWRATVLTLFPDMFPGPLGVSLAGKALATGLWALEARDIRDSATDRHRSVDDTPAGGGAGMVLRPDVLAAALDSVDDGRPMLALTPRGAPLTQARVRELAALAFDAVGAEGLSRVDFFYTPDGELIINEINTMPGFTPKSMYPQMWAASGLDYAELIDELIHLALNRKTGLR